MKHILRIFILFFLLMPVTQAAQPEVAVPPKPQPTSNLFLHLGTLEKSSYLVVPGDSLYKLAKKYKTTVQVLKKINHIEGNQINSGMKLKIPLVRFSVLIQKRKNVFILYGNGKPIKRYRVATGVEGSTPEGVFKIVNKLENPTWYKAGAVVAPESPENILGSRWLGFNKSGYGIHGTTLPQTIGTQASKGCIRMFNADVEEIYSVLPIGTRVRVIHG